MLKSAKNGAYRSVGALLGRDNGPACTVALLNVEGRDDAPAYVLTAGHCYPDAKLFYGLDWAVTDKDTDLVVRLNHFVDSDRSKRDVRVRRVLFATQGRRDLAVFELDEMVGVLAKEGFRGLKLSKESAAAGQSIIQVGVPVSWVDKSEQFLHKVTCAIQKLADVQYGSFSFGTVYPGALVNNCSAVGGISGSPLLSKETREIVGVASLGIPFGFPTLKTITGDDVGNYNLAMPTEGLYHCFERTGFFNMALKGCPLTDLL